MKYICLAFLLLTLMFSGLTADGCEKVANLTNFKYKLQQKVMVIRDALVAKYKSGCDTNIINCSQKSFDLCLGTGQRSCLQNFPKPYSCFTNGLWLSDSSGVRVSNALSKNKLSDKARKFICATALIQQTFRQIRQNNSIDHTYAYIGSSSGALRLSPSFRQQQNQTTNQCVDYDPRHRPWYVSAITGSKTTIILFDISRTMASLPPGARFFNAKLTLQIILQTLNRFDMLGLVVFSTSAKKVIFDKVVNANQTNKNLILNYIKNLSLQQGYTNYTDAIQKGMSMLQDIKVQCISTIFLLLTDGHKNIDQITNFTIFAQIINTRFTQLKKNIDNFKLISFVYGVEDNINYTLIKYLTCRYHGIIFRMWDGIDYFTMIQKLTSYYTFLSQGLNQRNISPIWSEFYQDELGFGMIVTVTVPIYVDDQIIGVAGIDIQLSKLQKCGYDLDFIQKSLIQKPQCFNNTLQQDKQLLLRCRQSNISCLDHNKSCSDIINNKTPAELCNAKITYDVFYNYVLDSTIDYNRCCGITTNIFITILVASFVGLLVIVVTICLYKYGIFHRIYYRNKESNIGREESQDSQGSLLNQINFLIDPQKKYKLAQENGIKIYRQPQFSL